MIRQWLRAPVHKSQAEEIAWGRSLSKNTAMWSGSLGQSLIQQAFPTGWKPVRKSGHEPDWETSDFVYEVKTQSWLTPGTAGEKILGVPIKYRNVPSLYGKPLRIVLFARAERLWFDLDRDPALLSIIDFWKSMGIEYVRGSELFPVELEESP
jgi:hypothetical protein